MSPSPREKYAARVEELASLAVELEAGRRPDPGPVAGRALEAAGDLLRRSVTLKADQAHVLASLGRIPVTALRTWAEGVDVADLRTRLQAAASQAVEAAIPDDDEAVGQLSGWAMQSLFSRDRLESALVALEQLAGRGPQELRAVAVGLRGAVDDLDAACRTLVTSFTALNPARRPEAALLDETARTRAWWFSARCGIEDDLLVAVLGGEKKGTLPRPERAASDVVMQKRARRISSDDLLRYDLGLGSPAERQAIQHAAEEDPELKLALAAMQAGEEAIEALDHDPHTPPAPIPLPRTPRADGPAVVEEHRDFKVLVFRNPKSVQVVVQPRHADRVAAAAVFRSDDDARAVPGRDGEHGLHFDLGAPERLVKVAARVVVKLSDGQSHEVRFAALDD
jgi:hypothetical protein